MYDAVLYYHDKIEDRSSIIRTLNLQKNKFILATLHRAENTNDVSRLKQICEAFNEISKETKIVLPLHPRTRSFLQKEHLKLDAHIIDPVGYFDMLALLDNCRMVMTDSGGLQKEAYFFGKFCVTLRDQTEWVELVHAGANVLAGADKKEILTQYQRHAERRINTSENLYGDGKAASKIVSTLITAHSHRHSR
jgi:UDP-GlcNAc3NAcA epimerase